MNRPLTAIANDLKGCRRILERIEGDQVPMLREAVNRAADQALRAGFLIPSSWERWHPASATLEHFRRSGFGSAQKMRPGKTTEPIPCEGKQL